MYVDKHGDRKDGRGGSPKAFGKARGVGRSYKAVKTKKNGKDRQGPEWQSWRQDRGPGEAD